MEKTVFEIRQKYRDFNISKETLKKEYVDFVEDKPQLFDMICSESCNDNILNRMLNAHRLVKSGSLSQHDASVMVGKDLVDTYVIPVVEDKS